MKVPTALLLAALALCSCSCGGGGSISPPPPPPSFTSSVATWHYDNQRTGANVNETALTLNNVKPTNFGELFFLAVDGAIVGQALYLGGVTIAGKGTHNVVYVATMHDSVFAFDADSITGANATPIWQISLLSAGAVPVPMSVQGCQNLTEWSEVGVVSTPVIDTSSATLYVVAKTYENAMPVFRLHALDVTSGEEKLGGPIEIAATSTINGITETFSSMAQTNRPGLLLENGHIYIGFGSNGCNDLGAKGWVLSYNASTLTLEGAFNTEPGKARASVWQKGGGLSSDSAANIYAETGDGSFNPGTNFGASILKLAQSGTSLQLADWFAPYNQAYLNSSDLDLNDPVLVLPDQPGLYPHLAAGAGKEGTLYLLDRDTMGQFCSTCATGDTEIVQELQQALGRQTGALVYWNSTIYSSGTGAPLMAWPLNNGVLPTTPAFQTARVVGEHSPIITSNGPNNGILWQLNGGILCAYNAQTMTQLYSMADTNGRDTLPPLPHFAPLMAINGKVYVSTDTGLAVFGLL
jgi:hypothetical protein